MEKRREWLPVIGCMAAAACIHLPALRNHLVADTWVFVAPGSFLETLAYFTKTIIPPEWDAEFLRPVPMLFFWLDATIWPGTEWGPHLTNVVCHVVNVLLISLIVRQALPSVRGLPLMAACLFYGLHPLGVGAVTWVAARFDVMSVTFGLAGVLLWLEWDATSKPRCLVASLLFLLAGLLSKEQGIVFFGVCFLMGFHRIAFSARTRKRNLQGLAVLAVALCAYLAYRYMVFNGFGGYHAAPQKGISFLPPFGYLAAIVYPFLNLFEGWSFTGYLVAAVAIVAGMTFCLWKKAAPSENGIPALLMVCSLGVLAGGLATTLPQPGMTIDVILGHGEARYNLVVITGLALLIGMAAHRWSKTVKAYRIALALVLAWSVLAAWRTDVQIQAWHSAGEKAHRIVEDVMRLAPDPAQGAHLIFLDVPVHNEQYAYIFGIGLKEALLLRYGRDDLNINRYPTRMDLDRARSGVDLLFQYFPTRGELVRIE